jgi:hypothetical protein
MQPEQIVRIGYRKGDTQGTGYLVAKDRILTARHVVWDKEKAKAQKTIWVELAGKSATPRKASVEWPSGEVDVDLAVLAVESPLLDAVRSPWLHEGKIDGTLAVETKGFPQLDDEVVHDELLSFAGQALSTEPDPRSIEIDVSVQPEFPEGWKGISGAPVFETGSELLLGVVSSAQSFLEGRLVAAAVASVADSEEFLAACRLQRDRRRVREAVDWIASALRDAPKVFAAVRRELQADGKPAAGEPTAAEVARAIVEEPADSVLPALQRAFDDLDRSVRVRIREIVCRALPCHREFTAAVVELGRLLTNGSLDQASSAATNAFAEVLLAGFDGRPCAFVFEQGRGVRGESMIPIVTSRSEDSRRAPVAEVGVDIYGGQLIEDLVQFLAPKLNVSPPVARAVDRALERRIRANQARRPPFFLLVPDDPAERERLEKVLRAVQAALKHLRILKLSRDPDHLDLQTGWMYSVNTMYEDDAKRDESRHATIP